MNHQTALLTTILFLASGCGSESNNPTSAASDPCAEAVAHLQSCFPNQPISSECHAETAQQILQTSCEDLAAMDGKADGGWMCIWMPWLCSGGGDDNREVSVFVERCAGTYGPTDCYGTNSAPCTLVVLEDAEGEEIARQYTGAHGSAQFDEVPEGKAYVRVLDRAGNTTTQVVGDYSYSTTEAKVEVPEDDEPIRIYLPGDSEPTVKACSKLKGYLDVVDGAGERLDAEEIEWGWLVRFLAADGTVELTRSLPVHPHASASDAWENNFYFDRTYAGEHVFEFIRMDIPSYARKSNPDYEYLLDRYAVESIPPESVGLSVDAADVPSDLELRHAFTDPLVE